MDKGRAQKGKTPRREKPFLKISRAKGAPATYQVEIDTGPLRLTGQGAAVERGSGASVSEADVEDAERELRELGATREEVLQLRHRLADQHDIHAIVSGWPTIGEDRRVLIAASDIAAALAVVLGGASPRASAELATAALQGLGDVTFPSETSASLHRFASALRQRVAALPTQARRQSRVDIVRAVFDVLGHRLGSTTNTRPEGPFMRACVASFVLAGIRSKDGGEVSPKRAIEAFSVRKGR